MASFRKRIFATGGNTSIFMGAGRKEFNPKLPFKPYLEILKESSLDTLKALNLSNFDEGVIGSFMSGRFLNQGNLPGFLPFLVPSLLGKPCVAVEGACGTGGKAIASATKTLLSDLADSVFILGFEMQNRLKPLYGADVLAGAAHYETMRKKGHAYFFPGLFDNRAKAYFDAYGKERTRNAFAKWYEKAILTARKNPKSQEYENQDKDLIKTALTPPNPKTFLPNLNSTECSKVTDGAASIALMTEEGLKKNGIAMKDVIELVAIGEAEGDITQSSNQLTELTMTKIAIEKALLQANLTINDICLFEIHDCFSISALLSIEALGLASLGDSPDFIQSNPNFPINTSGGLIGFGHPTGASGVRQLVDLNLQQTHKHKNQISLKTPYALLVSMGGDDKTVTCIITKQTL